MKITTKKMQKVRNCRPGHVKFFFFSWLIASGGRECILLPGVNSSKRLLNIAYHVDGLKLRACQWWLHYKTLQLPWLIFLETLWNFEKCRKELIEVIDSRKPTLDRCRYFRLASVSCIIRILQITGNTSDTKNYFQRIM